MIITSKSNDKIKELCRLRDSKYAKSCRKCIIETQKVVIDAVKRLDIDSIYISLSSKDKYVDLQKNIKCPIYFVSQSICNAISDTATPSDIFAIINIPNNASVSDRYLVLDEIQDPSNIGSIIRCAKAFGFDTIYAVDSAFAYSSKVIRSSMGYVFDVNIISMTKQEFLTFSFDNLYCADMFGNNLYSMHDLPYKFGLLLGSEGRGVSDLAKTKCVGSICVPMNSNVESLNVSVACGIILSFIYNNF